MPLKLTEERDGHLVEGLNPKENAYDLDHIRNK